MALQEVTNAFLKRFQTSPQPLNRAWSLQCRHYASAKPAVDIGDLENSEFLEDIEPSQKTFDPAGKARRRNKQLPPSRYHYICSRKRRRSDLTRRTTAIGFGLQDTIEDLSILTSHQNLQIQHRENSSQVHSPFRD